MSPIRRSVQPSADHSDRNGADQLHPNRLTLLPRTKDFLDSTVFSRGHDLSHGTDAKLSSRRRCRRPRRCVFALLASARPGLHEPATS